MSEIVIEQKRIYVIVAAEILAEQSVLLGDEPFVYKTKEVQPLGRQMAQAAHAVSKVRYRELLFNWSGDSVFTPVTTICLSARNDVELRVIMSMMNKYGIWFEPFHDTNHGAYGPGEFLTAVATYPIEQSRTIGSLDHLPLWGAE